MSDRLYGMTNSVLPYATKIGKHQQNHKAENDFSDRIRGYNQSGSLPHIFVAAVGQFYSSNPEKEFIRLIGDRGFRSLKLDTGKPSHSEWFIINDRQIIELLEEFIDRQNDLSDLFGFESRAKLITDIICNSFNENKKFKGIRPIQNPVSRLYITVNENVANILKIGITELKQNMSVADMRSRFNDLSRSGCTFKILQWFYGPSEIIRKIEEDTLEYLKIKFQSLEDISKRTGHGEWIQSNIDAIFSDSIRFIESHGMYSQINLGTDPAII